MFYDESAYIDVPAEADELHLAGAVPSGTFQGDDSPPPLPEGVFHGGDWVPPDEGDAQSTTLRRRARQ